DLDPCLATRLLELLPRLRWVVNWDSQRRTGKGLGLDSLLDQLLEVAKEIRDDLHRFQFGAFDLDRQVTAKQPLQLSGWQNPLLLVPRLHPVSDGFTVAVAHPTGELEGLARLGNERNHAQASAVVVGHPRVCCTEVDAKSGLLGH